MVSSESSDLPEKAFAGLCSQLSYSSADSVRILPECLKTLGPTLLVPMMCCCSCSSLLGVVTVSLLTHMLISLPLIGSVHSAGTDYGMFLDFLRLLT